ncbi:MULTISPECIES: cytoplasmic protein [unclassified Arthrobacter]|uniref:cytoplasmic protein n=1 Tax=unclassified Arthrobacter TaxID=235627 RepID=UPI001C848B98|nr:cytoplasmic protein [Arthrobacter sp. MAHUQ-56]MBX7444998.1 cytoplasmic protein [Arthrobacter sp. MAHUQ-56]
MADPIAVNPQHYRLVFENDRVRVLEYSDGPGDNTGTHSHPDSVMVTLSSFTRRLRSGGKEVDVQLQAAQARWLDAQEHSGTNTGETPTHCIFVELKEPRPDAPAADGHGSRLGPAAS